MNLNKMKAAFAPSSKDKRTKYKSFFFIILAILIFAFILWPLSLSFEQYGIRMMIFFLSLITALHLWRKKPSGLWLFTFFKSNFLRVLYYAGLLALSLGASVVTEHYLFRGLDIAIQITLCVFLTIHALKKTKNFLI